MERVTFGKQRKDKGSDVIIDVTELEVVRGQLNTLIDQNKTLRNIVVALLIVITILVGYIWTDAVNERDSRIIEEYKQIEEGL